MLITRNLSYTYSDAGRLQFPDMTVETGEQALILGPSGCGKTTLLHLLGGMLQPRTGEVKLDDTDLHALSGAARDRFRGQHIGIVFQKAHLLRHESVLHNLLAASYFAGKKQDKTRAIKLLERLNLGHKIKSKAHALSQGEQQRVSIARALMNSPKLILADEPTSSLDDQNCQEVVALLKQEAAREQATLLLVTHDGRLKPSFEKHVLLEVQRATQK